MNQMGNENGTMNVITDVAVPIISGVTFIGSGIIGYFVRQTDNKIEEAEKRLGERITTLSNGYISLSDKHNQLTTEIARTMFTREDGEKLENRFTKALENSRQETREKLSSLDSKMDQMLSKHS